MGTITAIGLRPRLRSAQLSAVDEIRVVFTQSHRIELLVEFRGCLDGAAFLRAREFQWWVGDVPACAVYVENTRLLGQVRVVLEPEDIQHQRFFFGVDWQAEIPDGFTQDPSSPDYDSDIHKLEAEAYNAWVQERSVTLVVVSGANVAPGATLVANVVHPDARYAEYLNERSRLLRTGRPSAANCAKLADDAPWGA
ncbi:MAG: hypothetical protein CO132_02800 [Candidatus Kerfeldbacteria bacterium CG_4_9_14_3_um_filter_45_8]|nr:MAG: hypothetical protein CO132_02800 [Candidatus Kerfeldbacteria bacterium CG_4_9_14_3_um_filter_45_8]